MLSNTIHHYYNQLQYYNFKVWNFNLIDKSISNKHNRPCVFVRQFFCTLAVQTSIVCYSKCHLLLLLKSMIESQLIPKSSIFLTCFILI